MGTVDYHCHFIDKWSNLTLMWAHLPLLKPYLTLTNVSLNYLNGHDMSNGCWDMNYCSLNFCLVWIFVTDRQTDRCKVMHKSPPCMSTGGLKKSTPHYIILEFIANCQILETWICRTFGSNESVREITVIKCPAEEITNHGHLSTILINICSECFNF